MKLDMPMPADPAPDTQSPETPKSDRRNVWAVSWTSFFTDISSEMVLHLVPLYLTALGAGVHVVGLIEGVAKAATGLLKLVAGHVADRLRVRKGLAVAGYGVSALAKPFFALVTTWHGVALVRWAERLGKGLRTAPRDALLADSAAPEQRGFVFGFHRAADTLGAVVGLGVAIFVVSSVQSGADGLAPETFRTLVWWSLLPAFAAVLILALFARDVPLSTPIKKSRVGLRGLGRPFLIFLFWVALFDLGDSSDAFLVLRASERGVGVTSILALLLVFNLVYALVSTPAGRWSDRVGRRRVLVIGWLLYAGVYLGFARVQETGELWVLFALYGVYYGLTHGTAKALITDLVPAELRGTAFGTFHGVTAILDLPASILAGLLWQGAFGIGGYGPAAPFYVSAALALVASIGLWTTLSRPRPGP